MLCMKISCLLLLLAGRNTDSFGGPLVVQNAVRRQSIRSNFRHNVTTRPTDDSKIESIFNPASVPAISSNFDDEEQGNVNIPSTGISISDEIEATQKDRFVTEVVEIDGLSPGVAAQIITTPILSGSFEPVRYLVALSKPTPLSQNGTLATRTTTDLRAVNDESESVEEKCDKATDYIMVDIPPFSKQLIEQINEYLTSCNGQLRMIVSTNRNSIHYDEAPAIYSTRRTDLDLWCKVYPDVKIVAYRLDIPRDCRYAITQVLDGYGPFALDENESNDNTFQLIESGRPLSVVEWDHSVTHDAFSGKPVPDDIENTNPAIPDHDLYTPEAIREREKGKRLLAIYTPGYSFGSITYILPENNLCCSGFTVPVEDNRYEENFGVGGSTGPALDCRGYISNSKNRKRQMESAKDLINTYTDRFNVILPARGDPFFLDGTVAERKDLLLETLSQYEKIGKIYEQLGIVSNEGDI
jgi:hypothetical protein